MNVPACSTDQANPYFGRISAIINHFNLCLFPPEMINSHTRQGNEVVALAVTPLLTVLNTLFYNTRIKGAKLSWRTKCHQMSDITPYL